MCTIQSAKGENDRDPAKAAYDTAAVRRLMGDWARLPRRLRRLSDERVQAKALGEGFEPLVEEIDREIARAVRLRAAVEELMEEMPEDLREIAELRYRRGLSYLAIAARVHYSETHVRRLKSRADRWLAERVCVFNVNQNHAGLTGGAPKNTI